MTASEANGSSLRPKGYENVGNLDCDLPDPEHDEARSNGSSLGVGVTTPRDAHDVIRDALHANLFGPCDNEEPTDCGYFDAVDDATHAVRAALSAAGYRITAEADEFEPWLIDLVRVMNGVCNIAPALKSTVDALPESLRRAAGIVKETNDGL